MFISNELYLDTYRSEGGVRVCTLEFIELIKKKYEVLLFPVKINLSLSFRIKNRLGLGSYDAYKPDNYTERLKKIIAQNNIKLVFLNLSNLIKFSSVIKRATTSAVKVIICSHGNESGDFLHEMVRFKERASFSKKLFSSYALGKMIKTESYYRLHFIDMVLTVSEIEVGIEKWLGAKKVFMVPRTVNTHFLNIIPFSNRLGFIGDLSHLPNYSGIVSFCDALQKLDHETDLRIVGAPSHIGRALAKKYPFITYLGYLDNDMLEKECITWRLFLNLVFYYSRGVSTKLARPLSWGLPVISTSAGIRGYTWKRGRMLIAESVDEMALAVVNNLENTQELIENAKEVALSMPTLQDIMDELAPQLQGLLNAAR